MLRARAETRRLGYSDFESTARERLGDRDPDDWPMLAAALAIGCPIWAEDTDFFGCGVPTWTTSRVLVFLRRNSSVAGRNPLTSPRDPEVQTVLADEASDETRSLAEAQPQGQRGGFCGGRVLIRQE